MKRLLLFSICLFIKLYSSQAQTISIPGVFTHCGIDLSNTTQRYTSFNANQKVAGKSSSAAIIFKWDGNANLPASTIPVSFIACFNRASDILGNILPQAPTITINVKFGSSMGSSFIRSRATTFDANFTSTDPKYVTDIFFPAALANKLANSDLHPSDDEVEIELNSTSSFYTGLDGQNGNNIDLLTALLHEVFHSIGFNSSAVYDDSGPIAYYKLTTGGNSFPVSFDRFIVNNASPVVAMTTLIPGSTSNLLFVGSDNIFWQGLNGQNANGGNTPQIDNSVRIGRMDLFRHLYSSFGINELMVNYSSKTSIHTIGPVGVGILNDIGWDISSLVGVEDYITIQNWGTPSTPITTLNIGSSYSYIGPFHDEIPTGDYGVSWNWKLEVAHSTGLYTLQTDNSGSIWALTVNSLPSSGYNWLRAENGKIKAYLSLEVVDNDGKRHKKVIDILINYKPAMPKLYMPSSKFYDATCDATYMDYYSAGATSYNIYQKISTGSWTSSTVSATTTHIDFTGLDETKGYAFKVEAVNSWGSEITQQCVRRACKGILTPNPGNQYVVVKIDGDIKIRSITLTNLSTMEATAYNFNGDNNEETIDVSTLLPGNYSIVIKEDDDYEIHDQFIRSE